MESETTNHNPTDSPAAGSGSGIDLYVTVRDKDGVIISDQCKNGDLYLYNFAVIIASILKNCMTSSAVKPYYVMRRDGLQMAAVGTTYASYSYNCHKWANQGKICVGGSSRPASVLDSNLGIPILEIVPLIPQIETSGNTLKVIITGTAVFPVESVLAEAGLSLTPPWFGYDTSGNPTPAYPTMITRDTFTPATVPAGGSMTIRFELWFNSMPPAT
jgi:hypothetical protein